MSENQVYRINVIISKFAETEIFTESFCEFLEKKGCKEIYYIYHTETDYFHSHILANLEDKIRPLTLLKEFCASLTTNETYNSLSTGIQIQPIKSWKGSIRYLIHADNPEKKQYECTEIVNYIGDSSVYFVSRDLSTEEYMQIIDSCYSSGHVFNKRKYLETLGLSNALRYLSLTRYLTED